MSSPPPQAACTWCGAKAAETHEGWLEDNLYLNMELLRELKKEQLRQRQAA